MEVAQEEAWTFAIPVYIEFTDRNGGVGSERRLESISDSVNASPEMRLNLCLTTFCVLCGANVLCTLGAGEAEKAMVF